MRWTRWLAPLLAFAFLTGEVGPSEAAARELILNGSFEQVTDRLHTGSWNFTTNQMDRDLVTTNRQAHSGQRSAYLGNLNGVEEGLGQAIAIPAGSVHVTLSFWWIIGGAEGTDGPRDYTQVRIRNAAGNIIQTPLELTNLSERGEWRQTQVGLTHYAGQTIEVSFETTTDSSRLTYFLIDDVSVLAETTSERGNRTQRFSGQGFDSCTPPKLEQMQVWIKESPYRAFNLYIGGNNRGCKAAVAHLGWPAGRLQQQYELRPHEQRCESGIRPRHL
ncbi:MAG: choice-of-anchor J domain-containing protein [Chloroflexi bacterium]|nr:choice-of-anchor J domain-containing protein [Chloroflexota bacterium]